MTGRVFYTSDPHFGHQKVSEIRGFNSTEDHDASIVETWSRQVNNKDVVYVLGDLAMSNHEYALDLIKSLPGTKHLIPGNHDPSHPMHRRSKTRHLRDALSVFDTVQPFVHSKLAGVYFAMSHFPYESWGDGQDRPGSRYNQWRLPDLGLPLLHGHTHGTEKAHDNMFHVGWDAWKRLVTQEEVIEWLTGS